jgi:hypothetical protein
MYNINYDKEKRCTQCGGKGVTRCDGCNRYTCPECAQLVPPNRVSATPNDVKVFHTVGCLPKKFRKEVKE